MFVLCAQFDPQHARSLAVLDHRRQVPVLAPQVCHQTELHLLRSVGQLTERGWNRRQRQRGGGVGSQELATGDWHGAFLVE